MIITRLSPDQARAARRSIGLSQIKVARAIGISRTKLALFEVEKYLLDDASPHKLCQFYRQQSHDFSTAASSEGTESSRDQSRPECSGIRLVDCFAVPAGIEQDEAEAMLAEITENDEQIEALAMQPARVSWWAGEAETEKRDEIIRLMARNYFLTRRLQGHNLFNSQPTANGGMVRELIG